MTADRVEPQHRRPAVVARDERGDAGQHVLDHRVPRGEVPVVLHPELRQRGAGHHRHPVEDPGRDERPGDDERGDGPAAEGLHVGAARVEAARPLGHGLAQVAPAALVAVADRLLARVEDVLDRRGFGEPVGDERAERHAGRGLGGEVLEQHVRGERGVLLVRALHAPHQAAIAQEERQGPGLAEPGGDRALRLALPDALDVGRLREGVEGELRAGLRRERLGEPQEVELVVGLHEAVESLLGDQVAVGAARVVRCAGRRPLDAEPRTRDPGEVVGMEGAEEHPVRRVGGGRREGAQTRRERRPEVLVPREVTGGLRAVPDETRRVGEEGAGAANDDASGHQWANVLSRLKP